MSDSGRVVYVNGELVPEAEARVSIYDSALMFGDMVFEMTRSFHGEHFKLREHVERLFWSMRAVSMPSVGTIEEVEAAVHATVEANAATMGPDDEHRVMIDVTRGLLGIYEGVVGARPGPNLIIADFPLKWTVRGMGHLFDTGINAVIPSQRAIPADLLDPKIKSRSRLHYLQANIQVSQVSGEDNWALLLDPDGFIAEGTGDNFFCVVGNQLRTPRAHNILRGVSRQYVMSELAPELGLEVVECDMQPYDVMIADEAFMTGTPFCMLPVTRLNGDEIGSGEMGPTTRTLLSAWSDRVGLDVVAQIKAWDAQDDNRSAGVSPYTFGADE